MAAASVSVVSVASVFSSLGWAASVAAVVGAVVETVATVVGLVLPQAVRLKSRMTDSTNDYKFYFCWSTGGTISAYFFSSSGVLV